MTIRACERTQYWQLALHLIEKMQQCSMQPDKETFAMVIKACKRGGQWPPCLALLETMQKNGLIPPTTYLSLQLLADSLPRMFLGV